ncbi:hypothetical protein HUJ04_001452 [Dendroctonus ponderosae]|nr:hypothetical protein HUJ04_001452 [Dendroctonus ponderosae]
MSVFDSDEEDDMFDNMLTVTPRRPRLHLLVNIDKNCICFIPNDFIEYTDLEFFTRVAIFPLVIGAIDCTHVKIQSPGGEDAERFRNRKGYFSWNVQTICDAQLKIIDIVPGWPEKDGDLPIELDFQNVGADELPSSITDSNISINNRMRSKIINNHFAHLL